MCSSAKLEKLDLEKKKMLSLKRAFMDKCGHKPESACSDINKSYSINGVALDGTLKALEIIGSPASIPLLEPVVPNPNSGGAAGI
jgi:hypothetical protein